MNAVPARLEWAIKPSFVAYVEALPDGSVEVLDGATRGDDGVFVFPAAGAEGALRFTGSVRFYGHHGVLDVSIGQLRIEEAGDAIQVTVAIGAERIRFATAARLLRSNGGELSTSGLAVTDDGASALGGAYPPGTALEPVHIFGIAA